MADRVGKVPGWKPEVAARAAGRFESCAIRLGEASRALDDGTGFETRRAFTALWVRAPLSPLATTQLVDGTALIKRCGAVRFRGGQPSLRGAVVNALDFYSKDRPFESDRRDKRR